MPSEVRKFLFSQAVEKLEKDRVEPLRSDIELAADDIEKIRAVPLQIEDEP